MNVFLVFMVKEKYNLTNCKSILYRIKVQRNIIFLNNTSIKKDFFFRYTLLFFLKEPHFSKPSLYRSQLYPHLKIDHFPVY